jgi:hypothetical protein
MFRVINSQFRALEKFMTQHTARFVLDPDTAITCPHCEREFALSAGFAKKALETIEDDSSAALAQLREAERRAADGEAQKLAAERNAAHERALAEVRAVVAQSFAPQIQALKHQLAEGQAQITTMDQRAAALVAGERQEFAKRLAEQGAQLQALQAEQLGLRQERQKLHDEKAAMALDVQRQVDARTAERETLVRTQEQARSTLEKAELQKKLDDVSAQFAEMQRKAEQGSQQLQGEVLERALEDSLRRGFPLDIIEEVKKGVRGGDVVHRVVSRSGAPAGVMLWETKRAQVWNAQWLGKLKEDMRAASAEVGVLVTMTNAIPSTWSAGQQFGLVDEVWVTTWPVAIQLAEVLRATLLDVHKQRLVSAGKGEKMEAVYDYVTSKQFAQKLRAAYDTFDKMREELESERNQATQRWARREKQLAAGMTALLGVGGEIQGLAQQDIPQLELEQGDSSHSV